MRWPKIFDFFKKKQEQPTSEFNIICPKCMVRMEKALKGSILIDKCKNCGGVWLDSAELEKLFEQMKPEVKSTAEEQSPAKTEAKKKAKKK